jgi:hypothetical protein
MRCDDRNAATSQMVLNQRSNKGDGAFFQLGQDHIEPPKLCVANEQSRQRHSSPLTF